MQRSYGPFGTGLLALIAGAILLVAIGAVQQVGNAGRSALPGTIAFDSHEAGYDIVLSRTTVQAGRKPEDLVAEIDCDARGADESVQHIRGARQGTSSTTDFGSTIGRFDGTGGRMEVSCRWLSDILARQYHNKFLVAKRGGGIRYAAYAAFALSAVLFGAGYLQLRRRSA